MNRTSIFTKTSLLLFFACAMSAAQAAPVDAWTLPNGARVLFVKSHAVPIVDIAVNLDAGARRDPQNQSGLAAMTCGMLRKGVTADRSAPAMSEAQLSDAMADIGAEIDCSVDGDRAIVKLRTLSQAREQDTALTLMGRMLAHPAFPENFLTREKARSIAAIKEADTKPGPIADKVFWRAMYGSHPYGNRPTVDSIDSITQADLVAFHRAHYASSRVVIAIVGDVSREQAGEMARQLTERLPSASQGLPTVVDVLAPTAHEKRIAHPASQAHIMMGMPAMARNDADYFALIVGNYILGGGGFVSRLVHEVREKRGMAYSVRSGFSPMQQPGPFQIGLQTKKEQSAEAIQVVHDTLAKFLHDGPTTAELKAAKDYMIGGFALNVDTNSKMLANVSAIGFYGLPLDYLDTWKQHVANVTAKDVRAAFQRKIDQQRMVTVIVGTPE